MDTATAKTIRIVVIDIIILVVIVANSNFSENFKISHNNEFTFCNSHLSTFQVYQHLEIVYER